MLDIEGGDFVDAGQHDRQHFSHVTDNQLEFRMPVERPRQHQAKHMDRGLRMPAPGCTFKYATCTRLQIGVIGLPHWLRRKMRMDIDRPVEFYRRSEQSVIARVIQETALGCAIDEGTNKVEVLYRAREFPRAGIGTLHLQRSEAREAIGMAAYGSR